MLFRESRSEGVFFTSWMSPSASAVVSVGGPEPSTASSAFSVAAAASGVASLSSGSGCLASASAVSPSSSFYTQCQGDITIKEMDGCFLVLARKK
jgi:hypothetical protein